MKATPMNLLKKIVYILIATPLFASATVGGQGRELRDIGGQGSGGGKIRPATPTEIREAIRSVWPNDGAPTTWPLYEAFTNLSFWRSEVTDPAIKAMLATAYGDVRGNFSYPVTKVISRVEVNIKDSGACYHKGLPKASTVQSNQLGDLRTLTFKSNAADDSSRKATLCFSVSEFRNIPKYALNNLIVAMSAHEIMHILNYEEPQAIQMEQFFLDNKSLITWDYLYGAVRSALMATDSYGFQLATFSNHSAPESMTCLAVGQFTAAALNLSEAVNNAISSGKRDRPFVINGKAAMIATEVLFLAESTKKYCGMAPTVNPFGVEHWGSRYPEVPQSNKAALKARMEQLPQLMETLRKMTGYDLFHL